MSRSSEKIVFNRDQLNWEAVEARGNVSAASTESIGTGFETTLDALRRELEEAMR
jgi:hypothetical protein